MGCPSRVEADMAVIYEPSFASGIRVSVLLCQFWLGYGVRLSRKSSLRHTVRQGLKMVSEGSWGISHLIIPYPADVAVFLT